MQYSLYFWEQLYRMGRFKYDMYKGAIEDETRMFKEQKIDPVFQKKKLQMFHERNQK